MFKTFQKPYFSRKDLGDLPQAAAIMHNNCWYLCHQLLKFGNTMTSESSDGLKITYVDQITQIRELSWLSQCINNYETFKKI